MQQHSSGRQRPVRIGILGTANIAGEFVLGVRPLKSIEVYGIASRSLAAARSFAAKYGIVRAFGGYKELVDCTQIDAVYIPLPNSMHADWTCRCLHSGKHVLCEKPLAASAGDAQRMWSTARSTGLVLIEAIPYRFQPQTLELLRLVHGGELGQLRQISAEFGIQLSGELKKIRLEPTLGGGALLDLGVYPLSLIRALVGRRPSSVQATMWTGKETVELAVAGTLDFGDGLLASVSSRFDGIGHRHARVIGTRGCATFDYSNHTGQDSAVIDIQLADQFVNTSERRIFPAGDGFFFETQEFVNLVRGKDAGAFTPTAEESLDVAAIIDALRESARIRRSITLST